jgi:hypothetical protein
MDTEHTRVLRELLAGTDWVSRTAAFARALRAAPRAVDGLFVVGTPTNEPWHLSAHLAEEASAAGIAQLRPTLVRHVVPPGAPAHLAVDLTRLAQARRGERVFVVAPDSPGEGLLSRLDDARRTGATLFCLDGGDPDLAGLAHEQLTVAATGDPGEATLVPDGLIVAADLDAAFGTAQHLVGLALVDQRTVVGPRGWRGALARFLDTVSMPVSARD